MRNHHHDNLLRATSVGLAGALALVLAACTISPLDSREESQPLAQVAYYEGEDVGALDSAAALEDAEALAELDEEEILEIIADSNGLVEDAQLDYQSSASPEDYALAVAAYDEYTAGLLDALEEGGVEGFISELGLNSINSEGPVILSVAYSKTCITVHKWQLQTIAWIAIGLGAIVTIAGLFASGTVIGLPAGAVAGAVGISLGVIGTFFLWKVDQQKWDSKRVCF